MPNSEITIECPEDYWRLIKFMGDFHRGICSEMKDLGIEQIGYNETSEQFWIAFDNDCSYGEKTGLCYADNETGEELIFGNRSIDLVNFLKEKKELDEKIKGLWEKYQ